MKLVPCIAWVRRGVPANTPQKVKLAKDDLKKLLQGASAGATESSETDDGDQSASGTQQLGLRGSARKQKDDDSDNDSAEDDQEADPDKRYSLDKYDVDDETAKDHHLKGLAVFPSNEDDPYVAKQDSDEEDEDFKVRPDDNLLLLGRVMEDEYGLEVYVYNEAEGSFYVHHDYPLECPPVCIEPINYDPGNEREGGNICAVGGLSSVVQLWDLDMVESLEPVGILGNYDDDRKKKKKKKSKAAKGSEAGDSGETSTEPKKKKKKAISHTEAVLDLSWNRHMPHILASCSADNNVILWDIDVGQGSNVLTNHTDKVQAVKWHPVEDSLLLSGGCDGLLNLWDCRQCKSQRQWSLPGGEVEKAQWNTWDPFRFIATSDTGDVYCIDSRQEAVGDGSRMENAHEDAVSGLTLHPTTKNCLATCGVDGVVKIWRMENGGEKPLRLITKKKLKLGKLFCCFFCPDNPWLLAIGGESEDGVYLWDIRKDDKVASEFGVSNPGGNGNSSERRNAGEDQDNDSE